MRYRAPFSLPRGKTMAQKAMALVDKATALDDLLQVQSFLLKTSFDQNMFVLAKFLRRCSDCASYQALLHEPSHVEDQRISTALLEMYAKSGDINNARHVLDNMPQRDVDIYNAMLAEYVNFGDILEARRLFDEMPERDLISWNTMIHGYAVSGDLGAAREMFDWTSKRDLVSWSSIISAYAQCRKSSEALTLFREMQIYGFVPDKITMVSVLSACGDMGSLGMGKVVHRLIERNGIDVDIRLGTSLIDMYAKCGDIENSLGVFFVL